VQPLPVGKGKPEDAEPRGEPGICEAHPALARRATQVGLVVESII